MKLRNHLLIGFLGLIFIGCSPEPAQQATTVPAPAADVAALQAAIAIPDPYAADIAEDILKHGGNAVDWDAKALSSSGGEINAVAVAAVSDWHDQGSAFV